MRHPTSWSLYWPREGLAQRGWNTSDVHFPGLDPFIEGQLWTDFHTEFIVDIRAQLMPQLRPRYTATVEERVYVEHEADDSEQVVVPDVTIARRVKKETGARAATVLSPEPVTIPLLMPRRTREPYLEIRRRDTRAVVAVLELLSPANKRSGSEGRRQYLAKRDLVLESAVHLLELDLLRGGVRLPMARPLPPGDYYAVLSRASRRPLAEVWAIALEDRLPIVPVPLANGDSDVRLDLQSALESSFDRAGYADLLDYDSPIEPPMDRRRAAWVRRIAKHARSTPE